MALATAIEDSPLANNMEPLEPNDRYIWKLVNNINNLREDLQLIDIILVCVDGCELPCHRLILAASNCPYFHHILMNCPRPCPPQLPGSAMPISVRLPGNLRGYCVARIINFMYTGQVEMPNDTNQVKELLAASRFLKLDDFNKQMAAVLVRSLTVDNYTFVWDLADEYDVTELRNEVVNYVSKDLPRFLTLPEFLSFDVSRLKLLLASPQANVHPHNKLLLGVIAWLKRDFASREKEIGQLMRYIKFCMLSKPFLKSVINTEPLVQESHTLWCFIAATLYSRGVHLQNYDPERDNITNPPDKSPEAYAATAAAAAAAAASTQEGGDAGAATHHFTPPVMTEPQISDIIKGELNKPKKINKEVAKLPPRKSPSTNVYTGNSKTRVQSAIKPINSGSNLLASNSLSAALMNKQMLAKKGIFPKKDQYNR